MSGPKLIELRRLRREARRKHNHEVCDENAASYERLFADWQTLCATLAGMGTDVPVRFRTPQDLHHEIVGKLDQDHDDEAAKLYQERTKVLRQEVSTLRRRVAERRAEIRLKLGSLRKEMVSSLRILRELDPDCDLIAFEEILKETKRNLESDSLEFQRMVQFEATMESLRSLQQRVQTSNRLSVVGNQELSPSSIQPVNHGRSIQEVLSARNLKSAPATGSGGLRQSHSFLKWSERLAGLPDRSLWEEFRAKYEAIQSEPLPERRQQKEDGLWIEAEDRIRRHERGVELLDQVQRLKDSILAAGVSRDHPLLVELESALTLGAEMKLPELSRRAAALIQTTRDEAERKEKRRAVLESLEELGYQPVEAMQAALVQGGNVIFRKPDQSEEYGVEVVSDPSGDHIQTALVRFGDSDVLTGEQRQRDIEEEKEWCGDHALLRQGLMKRGWDAELKMQNAPGAHPVRVVRKSSGAEGRGNRSPVSKYKTMEAGGDGGDHSNA